MISLVIPVFNEEETLPFLVERLKRVGSMFEDAYEVIFVDDASNDQTPDVLRKAKSNFPEIRVIRLSRNFGHQAAITAGIEHAKGDAVVLMDGDLQDPPEVIPRMIEKWREGFEVVYGIREHRKEVWVKRIAYFFFYRVLACLSDINIPLDAGDFCLMDRKVVDALRGQMPEKIRFVRGLRAFAGFKQVGIRYERMAREAGEAKYTFRRLIRLAVDGLFGFSLLPLRLASYLGFLIAIPSFLVGVYFIVHRIFDFPVLGSYAKDNPGLASLAVGTFFLGGVLLIILGIIGEYIGRIYIEVKRRPTYIVDPSLSD